MKAGLVREAGKKDNSAGRIPMVYDLKPQRTCRHYRSLSHGKIQAVE
ncbi:hypothetical protein I6E12_04145 [Prevotella brevis]|uniref:Uncharacterized protein n=1 Tax=Xylanibacter brevis TaxID=83231 RepID=A0ABS9CDX9_9BACT|nr:hypothetical protein [Xylanibacter brevis]MCF2563302.1 hypothetical protein [Xylanibacter brevis]